MSMHAPDGTGRQAVGELTTAFARVQGMLLSQPDAAAAVEQLARVAHGLVSSAAGAGTSVLDAEGRRTSTGATNRVVAAADALQYEIGEGLCLSAWASSSVQRVDDTATEDRWATWCAAVQGLGVRSVLIVPLVYKDRTIGAMKVYATTAGRFDSQDEHRLLLLAGAAATLLGAAQSADVPRRLSAGLQAALSDRQAVETATGMLMERHGLAHDAARTRLMATSRDRRQPLAELARDIVGGAAQGPA